MLNFIKDNAFLLLPILLVLNVGIPYLIYKSKKQKLLKGTMVFLQMQTIVLLLFLLYESRYFLFGLEGLMYLADNRTLSDCIILIFIGIIACVCLFLANIIHQRHCDNI